MADEGPADKELTDLHKLAIDAVIKRQQSLLELIRHTDMRAQQLVGAYVGFAGAALLFSTRDGSMKCGYTAAIVAVIVLLFALLMCAGAVFSFAAGRFARVGLPSRGPEFWQWAIKCQDHPAVVDEFLKEAAKHLDDNIDLQRDAARMLRYSMACGLAAVIVASQGLIILTAVRLLATNPAI
jgi:hypothetical protein